MTMMTTTTENPEPSVAMMPFSPPVPPRTTSPWDRPDWQRIWLATQKRPWQTLAVVPADDGMSTHEVSTIIAALGQHNGEPMGFADLRDVSLGSVTDVLDKMAWHVGRGDRVVLAMRSTRENLATIPIARAADAVMLCVTLGATPIEVVEEAVHHFGKERFLGSMLVPKIPAGAFSAPLALEPRRLPGRS